jgi:hypothetical protein
MPSLRGMGIEFTYRKGRANGYAGLDGNGKVPPGLLPGVTDGITQLPYLPGVEWGQGADPGYGAEAQALGHAMTETPLDVPFSHLYLPTSEGPVPAVDDLNCPLFHWTSTSPSVLWLDTEGWFYVYWQIHTSAPTVDAGVAFYGSALPVQRRLDTINSSAQRATFSSVEYLNGNGVSLRVWRGSANFTVDYVLLLLVPLYPVDTLGA